MINLLNANFTRLHKNKTFFFLLIFCTLFTYFAKIFCTDSKELAEFLTCFTFISSFVIAIFTNTFIGLDYSDGTIRNKIVIGHKRINIYFANLIISIVSAFIFYGMYVVITLPLAHQTGFKFNLSSEVIMEWIDSLFIGFISYSCIFTFISMNIDKRVVATIINVVFAILFIILPIKSMETVNDYHFYEMNKIRHSEAIYIYSQHPTKEAKEISQVILDITPLGHFIQTISGNDYWTKPPILFLYSLGTNIFITSLGIFLFNRKKLN